MSEMIERKKVFLLLRCLGEDADRIVHLLNNLPNCTEEEIPKLVFSSEDYYPRQEEASQEEIFHLFDDSSFKDVIQKVRANSPVLNNSAITGSSPVRGTHQENKEVFRRRKMSKEKSANSASTKSPKTDYRWALTDVANAIHGDYVGTGDTIDLIQLVSYRQFLESRLKGWSPTIDKKGEAFDNCMKALMKETLRECKEIIKEALGSD